MNRSRLLFSLLVVIVVAAGCARSDARHAGASTTSAATPTAARAPTFAEPAAPGTPVGPPAGHPLDSIDRDAGISVGLSDGSTLWLFGDSASRNSDDSLAYFVIGTAAWAPPGSPTTTRDYSEGGKPVAFATPGPGFPSCRSQFDQAGMWPSSAVVQHVGTRDRVVVWLEDVCLASGASGEGVGMAVAEWWYDPSSQPMQQPITATILNPRLFPRRGFGLAAVADRDGRSADVYSCDAPEGGGRPSEYGPCRVARIDLAQVANPGAYEPWNGSGWSNDGPESGTPIDMPGVSPATRYPAGGFSVALDPELSQLVMIYSPWPVRSTQVEVRVAKEPWGPWSAPSTVRLSGCDDPVDGAHFYCYAGTAQPFLSTNGRLGIGYYDSLVATSPRRGQYLVVGVPSSG